VGDGDVVHPVRVAAQLDLDGPALGGKALFFVAHRGRDPGAGVLAQELGEDGHQAAGPARHHRLPGGVVVERDGAAIGGHHETASCEIVSVHAAPPASLFGSGRTGEASPAGPYRPILPA